MQAVTFSTYRAINKPLMFGGLKGRYIAMAAIALLANFLLFVVLFLAGVSSYVCLGIVCTLSAGSVGTALRLSHMYGVHGWMKARARRGVPGWIRFQSRQVFIKTIDSSWHSQKR